MCLIVEHEKGGNLLEIDKLVRKAIKGDKEAFVELMEIYEKDMYNLSKYMLGRNDAIYDVVQDTIITAYEKIATLKNPSSFKSWLLKILVNKSKTQLSNQNKIAYLNDSLEVPTVDTGLEHIELMSLLSVLPQDFKTVMILYYLNDFSYAQISDILNIPEGTVKSRLFRGKTLLHQALNIGEEKVNERK